ncbi:MAG: hypothetical protein ACI8W8_004810 [Rhodothermales bacterium]
MIPCIVGVVGLLLVKDKEKRIFFGALYIGYLCYGLLFNYHIHTHDYYSLQLIPVVALPIGLILLSLLNRIIDLWQRNKIAVIAPILALALLGAAGAGGLLMLKRKGPLSDGVKGAIKNSILLVGLSKKVVMLVKPGRYQFELRRQFQEEIGTHVNHSVSTVYLSDDNGLPLVYNAAISGSAWPTLKWVSYFEKDNPTSVSDRFNGYFEDASEIRHSHTKIQNPDFFIVEDFGEYARQPDLAEFLKQFPIVAQQEQNETRDFGYIIFDLRGYGKAEPETLEPAPEPEPLEAPGPTE